MSAAQSTPDTTKEIWICCPKVSRFIVLLLSVAVSFNERLQGIRRE